MSRHWEMGPPIFLTFVLPTVIWDGQYRKVDIDESETVPLLGMQLLRGYDLRVRIIEGGTVVIEAFQ